MKNIKLNSCQAIEIINSLEVQIASLKSDMEDSFFPVSDIEKKELRVMQNLVTKLDKLFWTEDGELK